ncbi:hypothetical protein AVEN_254510-1, partial [Araneus ventricosus]
RHGHFGTTQRRSETRRFEEDSPRDQLLLMGENRFSGI